jgi:hypothetical protein
LEEEDFQPYPEPLIRFVDWIEKDGSALSQMSPSELACCFTRTFELPHPIGLLEVENLIRTLLPAKVLLQPGLEKHNATRGHWFAFIQQCIILIDAERPDASRIKTLFHEIAEILLEISYQKHPHLPQLKEKERERFANRFAAYLKMPARAFIENFRQDLLDIVKLSDSHKETLAGVTRHLRDLVMSDRPFYFCRFDIVNSPNKVCPTLMETVQRVEGHCVLMIDVVRTAQVRTRRRSGNLPAYILPTSNHYRVLHSVMNEYIKKKRAVYFSLLMGGASDETRYCDLFGEQNLSVLLVPYGKTKTRGFWLLAVHPTDNYLLNPILNRLEVDERGEIEWLFSNAREVKKRPRKQAAQRSLHFSEEEFTKLLDLPEEAYSWLES